MRNCPDCDAKPGEKHRHGCDVERCPCCGFQLLTCSSCVFELNNFEPEDDEDPTDEMYEHWDEVWDAKRLPWNGIWPGESECIEYDWWARFIPGEGWIPCKKEDDGARPNLNRLYYGECSWSQELQRWIKNENSKMV